MKRNILNSLLIILVLITVMSCKTKKTIVTAPGAAAPVVNNEKTENLVLLKSKDLPFNTLSLKGKLSIDGNGAVNNVNITVRIQKDEQIWASVTAIAGIEVARVLITPDSVFVRNNLQSVAVKKPFRYLNSFTNKQITFKMLQAILSGNTIGDLMNDQAGLNLNAGVFTLTGTKESLTYSVLFNTLLKPSVLNLNDSKAAQALKVVYSDYQQVTNALFPSVLKINSMAGTKKTNLTLDFSKIERNVPLEFPFTVPKRFETIN